MYIAKTGIYIMLFVLWMALPATSQGVISSQPALKKNIIDALDLIYASNFSEAEQLIQKIDAEYPTLPVGALLSAVKISNQILPKRVDEEMYPILFAKLDLTIKLCESYLKRKNDEEILFCKFTAHSMMAMTHAHKKEYFTATDHSKSAYSILKDGFNVLERNPDFNFPAGLYNFYIEQYPESYPVFKPLTIFFASGDKEKGLEMLAKAAEKGVFSKTEAKFFLSYIHLKYLNNSQKAFYWSEQLVKSYPSNLYYKSNYLEAAILQGKYVLVAAETDGLLQSKSPSYRIAGNIFKGRYLESQKQNAKAKEHYLTALKLCKENKDMPPHYKSLIYCGLARLAKADKKYDTAKEYYQKAKKEAEYTYVIKEIEENLD